MTSLRATWCDYLSPFYTTAQTDEEIEKYRDSIAFKLKPLETNMYDQDYNRIRLPLYPESGGLFPFLIDHNGGLYCWITEQKDSSLWPVACWLTGPVLVLNEMTIAKMLLGWLDGDPVFVNLWGDLNDFSPEEVRID